MVWKTYAAVNAKYRQAVDRYMQLLNEKEALFTRTQPGAIRYDRDRVSGGSGADPFAEYVAAVESEKLNERLKIAAELIHEHEIVVITLERQLAASKDLEDVIYYSRFIQKMKVEQISAETGYSVRSVWRTINNMNRL